MKLRLGVLFGGNSSEYSVSLHSAASMIRHISKEKYDCVYIGITESGEWYLYEGDIDAIENNTWLHDSRNKKVLLSMVPTQQGIFVLEDEASYSFIPLDCIFPILHGKNGEDGTIQGLLELSKIAYVGCDHLSSAICMDKEMTHIICERAGVPCAKYISVYEKSSFHVEEVFETAKQQLQLPFFVKPCNAGSSYGIHKVHNFTEFENALKDAFFHDGRGKVILEETIEGFEIGCAVLDGNSLTFGELDEIEITGEFFDFEGKYELKGSKIHCPARISEEQNQQALKLAEKVFYAMNCKGLARVDMFVCEDGRIVLNEVNTLPGFTETSRYPTMMKGKDYSFSTLIDYLIANACK